MPTVQCQQLCQCQVEVTKSRDFENLTVIMYACTDTVCHCHSKALPLGSQDVHNEWTGCLQAEARGVYAACDLFSCPLACIAIVAENCPE